MVFHFDGRYRSALECKFLEQVEEDLAEFWSICGDNSVLVFPPLSAHYRFLIHELVGQNSKLQTVSVGQGRERRTVVYFSPERDPDKMAHSPSTSQKTFFGRGRGRRPRRPDQALYVPGALRKAKCDQFKENASKESTVNSAENKSENREISKSHKDSNNDETSTLFTPKDGRDSIKPRSAVHETQTYESACHSILSTSERKVDSNTEGTDSIFFDTTVQHTNGPSHLFIDEQLWSENKESNRENVIEDDSDPVVTTSEKLASNALVKEFDDMPQIRDETDKSIEKTVQKITDDQSLRTISKKESSYGETDHKKDVHVDVNCGICQTPLVTTKIGDYNVDKSLSTFEDKTCDYAKEKPLTENVTIPGNQNQAMVKSETNCGNAFIVVARTEESNSLGTENQSFQDDSVIKTIEDSEAVVADCATVGFDGEDNVEQDESRNGNEETFQSGCENKGSSRALTLPGSGVFIHEEALTHAVKHYEEDVTTCELIGSQSKLFNDEIIEEAELRTSKEASMAVCKNAVNSKNSAVVTNDEIIEEAELRTSKEASMAVCENAVNSKNSAVVTSDVVNLTSSIDYENLESENNKSESRNSIDSNNEKIKTLPKTIEDASGLVRTELNENVGEVETEQQKTSKKKKGKKTKTKEQTEDKIKSKEKGEKKRKKEKKSLKDKIDKEVNLDSEEEKKSKSKVQSAKEQDKKVPSTCHIVTGKKLVADILCTGESFSAKDDDDDNDDDNWESNFDESGDCLNPDYFEELSRLTGIANPEVHKTQFDYYSFKPRQIELDDEEFGHILEIYNFSSDLTTQDLMQALSSFRSKGFDIKWVDDTHALAIFASRHAAQDAIQLCSGPVMKLRPVSEGTIESKKKAHYCSEFLQPYRERPQTSKLLADRLVTGALGMRSKMTREERVKEREKIKEAKSKRQQEKIQKAQIWGD